MTDSKISVEKERKREREVEHHSQGYKQSCTNTGEW
jgi:hypothetical protein